MYKISWGRKNDKHHRTFVIVPDAYALSEVYFVVTGYGRNDGCTPADVKVTDLDGKEIDMTKGLAEVASDCARSSRVAV